MVQINFAQKAVNVKVVYYGPGMSGKTTNLEVVHQRAPESNRGELTSISTDGDRTLFFDYMPLDLGTVAGMRTAFQIYTVPGQVYYNSTRKLVLQGVDGVIFIADSSSSMLEQNLESLRNLEENLNEYGKSLASIPHVIQYNKRDLPDAMPVAELDQLLNRHKAPAFEGVANSGQGVFPTLKGLAALVLKSIMQESAASRSQLGTAPSPARPAAPAAPAAGASSAAPRTNMAPAALPTAAAGLRPELNLAAQAMSTPALGKSGPQPALQGGARPATSPNPSPLAVAERPKAAAAAELMQTVAATPVAARRDVRPHSVPTATHATARRPQREPARGPAPTPRRRGGGILTGGLILLAAVAGAAIAWFALKVL